MKNFLLIATLLLAFSVQAQNTADQRQNDIIISPIELIAGPALNVSYERLLNKDSGIGINALLLLDNKDNGDGLQSQISPYYRMYFGKGYASGFFVEGFIPITTSNDSVYTPYVGPGYYASSYTYQKNTTVGAGIGFGGKWVARRNIVFEASIGIARRFGMKSEYSDTPVTGKGMLGIGYRF
ncbi:DUF3575 domain-containing protein [Chryseobacterium sp. MDT2-18]|uniref:DUF3575 domain-containing protein n=1 Tax=Chryseobacterium sp. MDT2-18 TaxID=1259136 RepID=UPI00277E3658|nr:DUF3575 domain-containing protein [Chryseobacterium sp. MDT2-18]MDQ0476003.1 hypothetical protein [Chryseobacterium sp. MDT2-18]